MRASITCKMHVGKRTYVLLIDCDVDHTDVLVRDNRYVSVYCNMPSINEKGTHKDYEKAFEISQDGDYNLLIDFKKNPKNIRIFSQYNEYKGPNLQIVLEGSLN